MRLISARIEKYRAIRDTQWFDIEDAKTILVGPNEAGKTIVLQALQQINPAEGVQQFDALRDYPRSEYHDITTGKVKPEDVTVVTARFRLDEADLAELPVGYEDATYVFGRNLDNSWWHRLEGGPARPVWDTDTQKDFTRMANHFDRQRAADSEPPSEALSALTSGWPDEALIGETRGAALRDWLAAHTALVDEENTTEENRHNRLLALSRGAVSRAAALDTLHNRLPLFVLFNNYFRVRPTIHLQHLADRLESGVLDDNAYDYGNACLMKLLGFTARGLSDLGKAEEPPPSDQDALRRYRDQLDTRSYQLNAASVRLTQEILKVWNPDPERGEASKLRVQADGQYLKVVVEDDLGVEVELDQRSEGFQWLVSFFVVFFAEAAGRHENAILLLDEPGLSLHGLKQREFRSTVGRLAEANQTVYTTHSPFLVGPDELDLVRVVEMTDRTTGTNVHTTVSATDPASLLPLQEALGYDLAQSLFTHQRNLVLEGLTDYWYLDATAQLLADAEEAKLNEKIALVSADSAGKVVYYATILHANQLKVAALLDSDSAGDAAAKQDTLVHNLGNKNILRTKDAYAGAVSKPEIEDLLRETLVAVAKDDLGWDITAAAASQPARSIGDIFNAEVPDFSKYRLAKAYLRWTRHHAASDLTSSEREAWTTLIGLINRALR
jgi:hypothetical protein